MNVNKCACEESNDKNIAKHKSGKNTDRKGEYGALDRDVCKFE